MASDNAATTILHHGPYTLQVTYTFHEEGYDTDVVQLAGPELTFLQLAQMYPLLQRRIEHQATALRPSVLLRSKQQQVVQQHRY